MNVLHYIRDHFFISNPRVISNIEALNVNFYKIICHLSF